VSDGAPAATPPVLKSDDVRFAHASERQFAQLLDFYQIDWEYEPRSFDLEWDRQDNVVQRFTQPFVATNHMVQVAKPVFRLGLCFPGETLLRSAEIIHTCSGCSRWGSARSRFSPIPAALRPVIGFPYRRLLWPLRRPSATSTATCPAQRAGGWASHVHCLALCADG